MTKKLLVLVGVCALALTACKKKDAPKTDEGSKAAASMKGPQPDAPMKSDAKPDPEARKLALQVLALQAALTEAMKKAMPDCDKVTKAGLELLDKPENKKLIAAVKARAKAVRAAQNLIIRTDKTKGAFVAGRLQIMFKCKGKGKHNEINERLASMWK